MEDIAARLTLQHGHFVLVVAEMDRIVLPYQSLVDHMRTVSKR